MAMGRQGARQDQMMVLWDELPRSPGHVFHDPLQRVLNEAGCDAFAETLGRPFDATRLGAPSLPPGRSFRMHLVGYFEGSRASAGWHGAAPTASRCGTSSASGSTSGCRITPG